jgi:hypothetical protein
MLSLKCLSEPVVRDRPLSLGLSDRLSAGQQGHPLSTTPMGTAGSRILGDALSNGERLVAKAAAGP